MFAEPGFWFLVAVALLLGLIPERRGDWRKGGAASADDVARIVAGGKPKSEPRHLLTLTLFMLAVLAVAFVFGGER